MTDLERDSDSDSQPRAWLPGFRLNADELAAITAKYPEAIARMREHGTHLINDPADTVLDTLDGFMVFFFIERAQQLQLEFFDMPDAAEVFAEAFQRLG